MPKLFSYCIPYDDGAAPNPFWDVCTIAICKPAIRRTAQIGDWIVGTGSKNSPIGDLSGKVVYAMEVSSIMTMQDYDTYSLEALPGKVPEFRSRDVRRRLGDSIYDFSTFPPTMRRGVHNEGNRERDLGGRNVLLSRCFYYFGDHPIPLPDHLLPIVHQGQGHKSRSISEYLLPFIGWIEELALEPNQLYGMPQLRLFRAKFPEEVDVINRAQTNNSQP